MSAAVSSQCWYLRVHQTWKISLSVSHSYAVYLSKRHKEKKVFPQGRIPVLLLTSFSFKTHDEGKTKLISSRTADLSETSLDYNAVCYPVDLVITLLTMSQDVEETKLSKVWEGKQESQEEKARAVWLALDWTVLCMEVSQRSLQLPTVRGGISKSQLEKECLIFHTHTAAPL